MNNNPNKSDQPLQKLFGLRVENGFKLSPNLIRLLASDIAGISEASKSIREGGEQVQISATELSKLSEQLQVMVAQFTV